MKTLILHISDIHLREGHSNPSIPKFKFVAQAVQNEEPDLAGIIVVVSGDLAFGGQRAEYDLAKECLNTLSQELTKRTNVDDIHFVFVPGNHDCDFTGNQKIRTLTIDAIRNGEVPDDEMLECCCKPQLEFIHFRNEYPTGKPHREESRLHWEYCIKSGDFTFEFRCFNTAWMSQLHEQQGALHIPDLVCQRNSDAFASDYIVSVFHHPYNWMPAESFRKFKTLVEDSSDLILTGHEHEADHFQKYSFKSQEVNDYLEGAVFQEHDRSDRAGFHAVFVDSSIQRQRTVTFMWDKELFSADSEKSPWVAYKRGSRSGKRDFDLSSDFAAWLDDPGANYHHPAKADLKLSDIFVFPNLKEFEISKKSDFIYGALIEGRDALKVLGSKRKVLVFGRQQSGKSTLAKILFRDLYVKNLTPVFVSGDELTKKHLNFKHLEELVESKFARIYRNPNLPAFKQLDKDKGVLIIDDFDHSSLNSTGRLKLLEVAAQRYDRLVILADDTIKLEELAVHSDGGDILSDFNQFEILQFGHLLRSKLITQWFSIGREYESDQIELGRRIHLGEQMVSTMLGKNYLPHYPVFILTLIQASESASYPNTGVGTYGSLYEVIITQSLATKGSNIALDTKMTYLSEVAHWMHVEKRKRITDDEWDYFHRIYCAKFKIYPSRAGLKAEFAANGLFDLRDERYGFRHSASYYYFVARYFRDNLDKEQVRSSVKNLLERLYKEEHASIWLFLTHLSKDPFLLDTILEHSRRIYAELPVAKFEGDVAFLSALSDNVEKIVLKDTTLVESKEAQLRSLDAKPELPELGDYEESETETNEALQMLSQMSLALRTLEVLGQLVKNFPGSLHGEDKLALVKECYALGLRTVSMLFDLFQRDIVGFVDFVYERLVEKHPEINDVDDLKRKVRKFMFWMIESASFGMVKRISRAVGHSQLGEIYKEVREQEDTNAFALIDIAIRLENLGFPEERLKELADRFGPEKLAIRSHPGTKAKNALPIPSHSKVPFCDRLLKQLVVEHFYLFPTREKTKQKVCAALQIEMQSIRRTEVNIDQQRLAPRSALPKESE